MMRSLDLALLLLKKAREDGYILSQCVGDPKMPSWALGFHGQQAVEKALKAILTRHAIEFPRTHDLGLLLELLREQKVPLPPDAPDLSRLTPFGVIFRYDEEPDDATGEGLDRKWTVEAVERTLAWAESCMAPEEAAKE
ncbi:MAG: HEPN domain-containing protein [Candidatus Sumerlaeota bacterium]|nr:HEPN domain-containing protein [Candidatus Sumerlaeota bacterium]